MSSTSAPAASALRVSVDRRVGALPEPLRFSLTLHVPREQDRIRTFLQMAADQTHVRAVRSGQELDAALDALGVRAQAPLNEPGAVQAALQSLFDNERYFNAKPLLELFAPDERTELLYETASVCGVCALAERRGTTLEPSRVVRRGAAVFLEQVCARGHRVRARYCGDYARFAALWHAGERPPPLRDVEELGAAFGAQAPPVRDAPLLAHVALFAGGAFRPDDALRSDVALTQTYYPAGRKFVLKAMAGGAMDMDELNRKALLLESLLPDQPLLLELTYERLVALSQREDSCFLRSGIYPAVQYYIEPGKESQCEAELTRLCDTIAQFEGIQVVVTLVAELPVTELKLGRVLSVLRARPSLVRVVVVQLARKPRSMVEEVQEHAKKLETTTKTEQGEEEIWLETTAPDPFELVDLLHDATDGQVNGDDFFPANMGRCLEPLLNLMGHGFFFIRPSPYCALATCLVSGGDHQSVPLPRLFNVEKFWNETQSLLPRLQDGKVGMINGVRLQRALKASLLPEAGITDLWPYLIDKSKADVTRDFIAHVQFIVVHNHMDVATFDAVRRCQCAAITVDDKRGYIASCSKCI